MTQETRLDLRFPVLAVTVVIGAIACVAVAAAQAGTIADAPLSTPDGIAILGLLAASALIAEALEVAIPGAGGISMSYPLFVACAVCLGPLSAGGVAALSLLPFLIAYRKAGWPRLAFNIGQVVMTAVVPGLLYIALGGSLLAVRLHQAPAALLVAGTVGTVVNLGLGAIGVSFLYNHPLDEIWRDSIAWMVPSQVVLGFVGLAIAEVLGALKWPGFALFVLPLLVARQTYQQSVRLREAYADTISSLVAALEAKDVYTKGHSVRVAEYTVMIARAMGFKEDRVRRLEQAALLHDLGKVGVSRRVLSKEGRLTQEEYDEIKRHPDIGAHIVADVPYLADLVPAIQHHHERLDGHGYGGGASGDDIPVEARILAVADSYDAMTSARPYRGAMSHSDAVRELRDNAGTQFDPNAVEAFERAYADAHTPEGATDGGEPRNET